MNSTTSEPERAVLSACINNKAAYSEASAIISSKDFGSNIDAAIFSVFGELTEEGVSIDVITVESRLNGELSKIGGGAYLTALLDSRTASVDVKHHARIVADARERQRYGEGLSLAYREFSAGKPLAECARHIPTPCSRIVPLVELADVEPKPVDWIWRNYIPRGKLTILDGDPGLGKSTISIDIASRVSTGNYFPGDQQKREAAGVVFVTSEDGAADTIRPRLDAAGAIVSRIALMPGHPTIPSCISQIEAAIIEKDAELLIIDPIMAHLDDGVNSHKDSEVRKAFSSLGELADRTRCAVLLIRHPNKSVGQSAIYRGGGSIAIIGAARAGLMLFKDPEDDTRRILASTKSNLGPEPPAIACRVVVDPERDKPMIQWEGVTAYTADELVAERKMDRRSPQRDKASEFLLDTLAKGPRLGSDVYAEAEELGIKGRTLETAKKNLGVLSSKRRGQQHGPFEWRLPVDKSAMSLRPCDVASLEEDGGKASENSSKNSTSQGRRQ